MAGILAGVAPRECRRMQRDAGVGRLGEVPLDDPSTWTYLTQRSWSREVYRSPGMVNRLLPDGTYREVAVPPHWSCDHCEICDREICDDPGCDSEKEGFLSYPFWLCVACFERYLGKPTT
jgi:hypothetical protein